MKSLTRGEFWGDESIKENQEISKQICAHRCICGVMAYLTNLVQIPIGLETLLVAEKASLNVKFNTFVYSLCLHAFLLA